MNRVLKKIFICFLFLFSFIIMICTDTSYTYKASPIGSDFDFSYTLKQSDYRVSLRSNYITEQAITWFEGNVGFNNLTISCIGYVPSGIIQYDFDSFVLEYDTDFSYVSFMLFKDGMPLSTIFEYYFSSDLLYVNDLYIDNYIYITNSSFPLTAPWNYFFVFEHYINGGAFSFTNNDTINISNLNNTHVNFNITGTSVYVYTVNNFNYQSFYQLGINLTNNTEYSLTYMGNNILYSDDAFYLTSSFKNLFFDAQWVDAVFWNWLDTVGVWYYIPYTTEQYSVNDLIDTYVNIPIRITHDMLDWSAFGVNILVAFGVVIAVIIGIKIIKRLY